jgi:hypothetical protein
MSIIPYISIQNFLLQIEKNFQKEKNFIISFEYRNLGFEFKKVEQGLGYYDKNGRYVSWKEYPNNGFLD